MYVNRCISKICSGILKTRWFILPIVVFTLIFNIPKFFELKWDLPCETPLDLEAENCTMFNQTSDLCSELMFTEEKEQFWSEFDIGPTEMRKNRVNEKKNLFFPRKLLTRMYFSLSILNPETFFFKLH